MNPNNDVALDIWLGDAWNRSTKQAHEVAAEEARERVAALRAPERKAA